MIAESPLMKRQNIPTLRKMNAQLSLESTDSAIESIRRVEVFAELIAAAACSEVECSEAIADGARFIHDESDRLREILGIRR